MIKKSATKILKTRSTMVLIVLFTSSFLSFPASATWSILAVDRDTGEIGIAGASCTFDVSGIASLIPKEGAIVVQAASNYFARMEGVELMENGASVEQVLSAMKAEQFSPERQQYGVISVKDGTEPLTYSGSEISDWNGGKSASDFTVIGNILVGQHVVDGAFDAYNDARHLPFGDRLMASLSAGADSGGDNRCGEQKARSAFIMLYSPETESNTKLSVFGIADGGRPAVELLQAKYKELSRQ